MAKESKDEEYLDNLLNSVTNEDENWLENELENFQKELVNVDDNINKDDVNDIDINDITGSEDDKLEDLMKLLDSYENESETSDEVSSEENADDNKKLEKESIEKASEAKNNDVKEIAQDNSEKKKKEKKPKKESFIKKLFSKTKKENLEEHNNIDSDEILSETGSAFEDMENLVLDDVGIDVNSSKLFSSMESLDDIPEVNKEENKKEKKKEKKNKNKKEKVKKQKVAKQRKPKVKKEKIPVKEEYIKISPLSMILAISVMIVFILAVYLGSSLFSYNSNIDKATNYYVDKEYEKAYDILAGMDIKATDKNFYNQVENIMKVQKYINDFEAYMELEMYVYALESLVKGIASFDANLNKASELGTYDILVEKSNEIDGMLKNYFNMSIEEARTLNQISNSADFGRTIYNKAKSISFSSKEGN